MLKHFFCVCLGLIFNTLIFTSDLPTELLGISIGENFNNVKKMFLLKNFKKENFEKIYKVIYSIEETNSFETYIAFFESKVSQIKVFYNEAFITEDDWQNLYNQAITYYGMPNKVEINQQETLTIETYLWENEKVKYEYKKISQDNKIKNFTILLKDKLVEQKISELSPIKKFFYKLF